MGYRLSGIGGAREIFVCSVETAETIIIETLKKQDKIFKKLISGFKNVLRCGFIPDFMRNGMNDFIYNLMNFNFMAF